MFLKNFCFSSTKYYFLEFCFNSIRRNCLIEFHRVWSQLVSIISLDPKWREQLVLVSKLSKVGQECDGFSNTCYYSSLVNNSAQGFRVMDSSIHYRLRFLYKVSFLWKDFDSNHEFHWKSAETDKKWQNSMFLGKISDFVYVYQKHIEETEE